MIGIKDRFCLVQQIDWQEKIIMNSSAKPPSAYCCKKDMYVSLDQTEGHCRDLHQCDDSACPLEDEFGQHRFSRTLNALAVSLGDGFARPLGKP